MAERLDPELALRAALEDALRTYPLVPEPPTLLPGTVARVRRLAARPRFRLGWLDGALILFAALMGGVIVWLCAAWLPAEWIAQAGARAAALLALAPPRHLWLVAAGATLLLPASLIATAALALGGRGYARLVPPAGPEQAQRAAAGRSVTV